MANEPDDSTPEKNVLVQCRVPRSDYDRFIALFPMYGASAWFIRTAIHSFVQQMESQPDLVEQVQASIAAMLSEAKFGK